MTIYNGRTSRVTNFLRTLGHKPTKYQNPADQLLKLAHEPKLLNKELTMETLTKKVAESYICPTEKYDKFVKKNMSTDFWITD